MERARDILGVRQDWLGFVDSGWPEGDPKPPLPEGCFALVPLEEAAAPLVRLIREFRPHVMTTYDERGGYPHPDHVKTHEISVEAFAAAADPERYPELGEPWQLLKLYYHHSFNRPRMQAIHDAMIAHGLESPWEERLKEWKEEPEWDARITTRVPCADYFGVRDQALLAHATQIDPDGFWFAIPRELQVDVWPTEDYELVTSHVDSRCPRTTSSLASRPPPERMGPWWSRLCCSSCRPGAPGRRRAAEPEDVKAGWTAFVVFLLLALAVVLLGFSLTKQLRKAQAAKDAGVYGDDSPPPRTRTPTRSPRSTPPPSGGSPRLVRACSVRRPSAWRRDQVGQLAQCLEVGPAVEEVLHVPSVAHARFAAALLACPWGFGQGLGRQHCVLLIP